MTEEKYVVSSDEKSYLDFRRRKGCTDELKKHEMIVMIVTYNLQLKCSLLDCEKHKKIKKNENENESQNKSKKVVGLTDMILLMQVETLLIQE